MVGSSMLKSAVTNQLAQSAENKDLKRQTETFFRERDRYYGLDGVGAEESDLNVLQGHLSDHSKRKDEEKL
jgi:hypothetical protein